MEISSASRKVLQGIKESDKESVSRGCDEEEDLSIVDCSNDDQLQTMT